jgi:hypothetical protein
MDLKGIELEGVDCIYLVQNMDYWWAVLNTVYTFGLYKIGDFIL